MRSHRFSLIIGAVFVLFIGAYGSYQYFLEDHPSRSAIRRSPKKPPVWKILKCAKTENVENEPSVLFNDPAINQA